MISILSNFQPSFRSATTTKWHSWYNVELRYIKSIFTIGLSPEFPATVSQQIHFLTGRLAEKALRDTLSEIAHSSSFTYTIQVMPITVAALMTPDWIARNIDIPGNTDLVIVPGYCQGDLTKLTERFGIRFEHGPKDLRRLDAFFGNAVTKLNLDSFDIEIIAEINHAPNLSIEDVVQRARALAREGADIVDIGCIPGHTCRSIGDYVAAVKDVGLRASIDSLNVTEIEAAVQCGAELVLSVNASNLQAAPDWGVEVVVIPDEISNLDTLDASLEHLDDKNVAFRIDPILEPIGLGFAASMNRYFVARSRWPDAKMMMGIGNLTELSDVDSAGVNFLLLGYCQELSIGSILTTQVINWARSSVAECNIARRLVHFACHNRVPPKNLSEDLVILRDARPLEFDSDTLNQLATQIKDHNYRLFANDNKLWLMGEGKQFSDIDPFRIFDQLAATQPKNLDASHSFYLGYELCKAMFAVQLGKNYVQDEALNWGHLTIPETNRHRLSKRFRTASENRSDTDSN